MNTVSITGLEMCYTFPSSVTSLLAFAVPHKLVFFVSSCSV